MQYVQLFFGSQKSSCPLLEELLTCQAKGHHSPQEMELPPPEGIKPTDTVLLQNSQQGWHYLFWSHLINSLVSAVRGLVGSKIEKKYILGSLYVLLFQMVILIFLDSLSIDVCVYISVNFYVKMHTDICVYMYRFMLNYFQIFTFKISNFRFCCSIYFTSLCHPVWSAF